MLNAAAFFDRPKTTARIGQRKLDDWYPPLENGLRAQQLLQFGKQRRPRFHFVRITQFENLGVPVVGHM